MDRRRCTSSTISIIGISDFGTRGIGTSSEASASNYAGNGNGTSFSSDTSIISEASTSNGVSTGSDAYASSVTRSEASANLCAGLAARR